MCVGCGCWMDTSGKAGGDGNHLDDSTKMPNIKTDVSPLATKGK
jgi:hypothetical protein